MCTSLDSLYELNAIQFLIGHRETISVHKFCTPPPRTLFFYIVQDHVVVVRKHIVIQICVQKKKKQITKTKLFVLATKSRNKRVNRFTKKDLTLKRNDAK